MRKLAVIGIEKEVIELAKECGFDVVGIFDNKFDNKSDIRILDVQILGDDDSWETMLKKMPDLKAVIALDTPSLKEKLANKYGLKNLESIRAKDSHVSATATIQEGSIVQRGVKIMPDARIGKVCKLNVNATVHHDCVVGNYCTLAPGSMLLGAVVVEDRVFVGAGAIILPKVKVGHDAVVGAGAVVVHDVPPGITVVGVPAKPYVKKNI